MKTDSHTGKIDGNQKEPHMLPPIGLFILIWEQLGLKVFNLLDFFPGGNQAPIVFWDMWPFIKKELRNAFVLGWDP